jgi:hypothetical protein
MQDIIHIFTVNRIHNTYLNLEIVDEECGW